MRGKEAGMVASPNPESSSEPVRAGAQRTWARRVLTGAALVAVGMAVRHFWGPADSSAQAPIVRPGQVARPGAAPAAGAPRPAQPAGAQATGTRPAAPTGVRPATAQQAAPSPSTMTTMAIVNGQSITRDQLAQECLLRYGEEILELLVNKQLILGACQQRNIQITARDVDAEITAMAGRFGLPVEKWLQLLEEERDISPDKYRSEVVWPMLALRRLAATEITITPEELREAFESEYGPKIRARLIMVGDRAKAEQLRAQAVAAPDSFGDLAKEHSEDVNSASARGLIPPIRRHIGDAAVEQAAFALQEGQISPVIEAAGQFLILKCDKRLAETYLPAEQAQAARQELEAQLRDHKLREAAGNLFETLQKQARVTTVFEHPEMRTQQPGVAALINGQAISMQALALQCLERHGREVLEGEINRALITQELARRKLAVSQADVDAEIERAAATYGFLTKDGRADVEAWLKKVTEGDNTTSDLYVRDAVWPSVALKLLVRDKVQISEQDIQQGFESNYGERVQVLAIVTASMREAQAIWPKAKQSDEKQFGDLAFEHSIEPVSKANYGQVPPIQRHSGHDVIEQEAFRLKAGEVSGIVAAGDKFVIMKCLGRTEPQVRDIAAVRDELVRDIEERKLRVEMAKQFDLLHDQGRIENFLASTAPAVAQPAAASQPAATQARAPAAAGPRPVAPTGGATPAPAGGSSIRRVR